MKKTIISAFILIILFAISSCKEYLDKPKPTDQLTSEAVYSTREGVEAYISGIYRLFRSQYPYTTDASGNPSGTTDVGGIYSMYFARTVKGNDLIEGVNWYLYDYAHENREPNYRRVTVTWQMLYEFVKHANTMIREIAKSDLSTTDKVELTAHARALRAFFYFELALEYQINYNPSADAPPLYDENDTEAKGMSTMQELFAFIIADINAAIEGLAEGRLSKSYINVNVANGLKARILQYMNQSWDQVEAAAHAAYGGDVAASLGDYDDGFDDITNPGWLWGSIQQDDQTNYYYCAPHAFIDHYSDAYFATFINTSFVNQFSATDVRNMFENGYGVPDDDYRSRITWKFAFSFTADIPLMRKAEMILIEAEAMYHQGNETGAHNLLYSLQSARDPNAVQSSTTGTALLDEILLERRKELYGEIGVEWFDAKRLGRGITRDGNHRVFVTIAPNDLRFMLKIPQDEIDANDNITDAVNSNR